MKHLFFRSFLAGSLLFNGVPISAQNSNAEISKMSLIFSVGALCGAVCGWFTYKTFVHKKLDAELRTNRNLLDRQNKALQQKDEQLTQAAHQLIDNDALISGLKLNLRKRDEELVTIRKDFSDFKQSYASLRELNKKLAERIKHGPKKGRDDLKDACLKHEKNSRRFEQKNRQKHVKLS